MSLKPKLRVWGVDQYYKSIYLSHDAACPALYTVGRVMVVGEWTVGPEEKNSLA